MKHVTVLVPVFSLLAQTNCTTEAYEHLKDMAKAPKLLCDSSPLVKEDMNCRRAICAILKRFNRFRLFRLFLNIKPKVKTTPALKVFIFIEWLLLSESVEDKQCSILDPGISDKKDIGSLLKSVDTFRAESDLGKKFNQLADSYSQTVYASILEAAAPHDHQSNACEKNPIQFFSKRKTIRPTISREDRILMTDCGKFVYDVLGGFDELENKMKSEEKKKNYPQETACQIWEGVMNLIPSLFIKPERHEDPEKMCTPERKAALEITSHRLKYSKEGTFRDALRVLERVNKGLTKCVDFPVIEKPMAKGPELMIPLEAFPDINGDKASQKIEQSCEKKCLDDYFAMRDQLERIPIYVDEQRLPRECARLDSSMFVLRVWGAFTEIMGHERAHELSRIQSLAYLLFLPKHIRRKWGDTLEDVSKNLCMLTLAWCLVALPSLYLRNWVLSSSRNHDLTLHEFHKSL